MVGLLSLDVHKEYRFDSWIHKLHLIGIWKRDDFRRIPCPGFPFFTSSSHTMSILPGTCNVRRIV